MIILISGLIENDFFNVFFFLKKDPKVSYASHLMKAVSLPQNISRFLFFFIFFKFYFIFKLYKIVLVLPNIKMNPSQVYMCSPS